MHVMHLFKQSYLPKSGVCFMDGRKFTGWIYVVYEKTEQWVKVKKKKKKVKYGLDSTFMGKRLCWLLFDTWVFFQ